MPDYTCFRDLGTPSIFNHQNQQRYESIKTYEPDTATAIHTGQAKRFNKRHCLFKDSAQLIYHIFHLKHRLSPRT